MKLRFAALAAVTVMALASCSSAITYEEWKAKVDAVEEHQYKTAVVNGEYKIKLGGEEKTTKFDDVGFSYNGNNWVSNHANTSMIKEFVGISAKDFVESKVDIKDLTGFVFFSDLSIEFKYAIESGTIRSDFDGSARFDKYAYLNDIELVNNTTDNGEKLTYVYVSINISYGD